MSNKNKNQKFYTHAFVDEKENEKVEKALEDKTYQAVALVQLNAKEFVSCLLTIKNKEVIACEVSNPDTRLQTEATAKINFVDTFYEKEE